MIRDPVTEDVSFSVATVTVHVHIVERPYLRRPNAVEMKFHESTDPEMIPVLTLVVGNDSFY